VLAVGDPAAAADRAQEPSWDEIKRGGTFGRKNIETAERAHRWLQTSGDQIFVLYGTWHVTAIRRSLAERGVDSVILVPFLTDVELALRERLGAGAEDRWFELAPGVFRAPYVTASEIGRS
jgi:hypothetical protein